MARPTTFKFGELLIEVGRGTTPETYEMPCGLTTKSFNATAQTSDTNVPDCDDPDAPSWLERDVTSLSRDISGSGILADEFLDVWDNWFNSGNTKNVRISMGDFRWTGGYILSQFSWTANIGNKVEISVTMQSDGQITRATVSD